MRGVTVTLYEEVQTGTDAMNAPVYRTNPVEVPDVLIGEPRSDEIVSSTEMYEIGRASCRERV